MNLCELFLLKELIGKTASVRRRFDDLSCQYSEVISETLITGQEVLVTERETFKSECDQMLEIVTRKRSFIEDALQRWARYDTNQLQLTQWMQLANQQLQQVVQANIPVEDKQHLTSKIQVCIHFLFVKN